MKTYIVIIISVISTDFAHFNYAQVNISSTNCSYQMKQQDPQTFKQNWNKEYNEKFMTRLRILDRGQVTRRNMLVETQMLAPAIIRKHNYPCEIYTVYTIDGYVLQMHRIPWGLKSPPTQQKKPVVFLMHGLFQSSVDWILNGPDEALGYVLADAGYDVWMGNARGNRYSRNHVSISPSLNQFWDFTFHHIGYYDLPAMIDFTLNKTGHSQLVYTAHSQGTTAFFVLLSEHPEYNQKIKAGFCLSAIAFLGHMKSPFFKIFAMFSNAFGLFGDIIGYAEFRPRVDFLSAFSIVLCHNNFIDFLCAGPRFLLGGFNPYNINMSRAILYHSHQPAGISLKQLQHFGQLINADKFQKFDWAVIENYMIYGGAFPPEYNLGNIKVPVNIFHSQGDWLASNEDVNKLLSHLANGKLIHVEDQLFNHNDYMIGMNARIMVYDRLVGMLNALH